MRLGLQLLLALSLLSGAASAKACRCEQRVLADYFTTASSVTIGVLQSIEVSALTRQLKFTLLDDSYKGRGTSGSQVTYSSSLSSAGCGVTGAPGTVFILFTSMRPDNSEYVDTCSGTRPLRVPGKPQPEGFKDVPIKFVTQQLTTLAALEALRASTAAQPRAGDPENTTLLGLLDIEPFAHGGKVDIFAKPEPTAKVLARIDEIDQLYNKEVSYEFAAAIVYSRQEFGYRVRLSDGRFGWVEHDSAGTWFDYDQLPVNRLSYLTAAWQGFLWPDPGAGLPTRIGRMPHRNETPVNVLKSERIGGTLWFYVERLSSSPCEGGEPKSVDSGWLPAYGLSGEPAAWFYSRGC